MDIKTLLTFNDICIPNHYLESYIQLINNPSPILEGQLFETHHILPRSYFSLLGKECDNSSDNLIKLNIQEHTLAHYYLSLCANNPTFKYGNMMCISLICNRDYTDVTEQWILDNLVELENIRREQRRLNSTLQKGIQSGANNPNSKINLEHSMIVKKLLKDGMSAPKVASKTGISVNIIRKICRGTHWTCSEDKFSLPKTYVKDIALQKWIEEKHTCTNCDKIMTTKYKDGIFCSPQCSYSYSASNRTSDHYKKAMAHRRSYKGENNPNYGKQASDELRHKMSEIQKVAAKTSKSTRFRGHSHSEESKIKISESLKNSYNKKRLEVK